MMRAILSLLTVTAALAALCVTAQRREERQTALEAEWAPIVRGELRAEALRWVGEGGRVRACADAWFRPGFAIRCEIVTPERCEAIIYCDQASGAAACSRSKNKTEQMVCPGRQ